jgi:hypothetical protein
MIDPVVGYWIVIGVALLLAGAAVHKLRDRQRFTEILVAYRVLPQALAQRSAGLIPCLELAAAALLGWSLRGHPLAALPAISLLVLYALGLSVNLARGRYDLDCGCEWAGGRRPIASWMVWRNALLALALASSLLPWSPRVFTSADGLLLASGLVVAAILYAGIDRLLGEIVPKTLALRGRP